MNIDNPGGLPPWNLRFDSDKYTGDEWKYNPKLLTAQNLYEQLQVVYTLLRAVFEIVKPIDFEAVTSDILENQKNMFLNDAEIIAAKIHGAEAGDLYVIRMQNAAIIRQLASGIQSATYNPFIDTETSEKEIEILRNEIKKFRLLFIDWVESFEKDDFEDEWGLFK